MRYFNTSGPCIAGQHYMLPPEARLPGARRYIERQQYFVVHAPRQTGKTTTLAALARSLSADGFAALRVTCEPAEAAGDDYAAAEAIMLDQIRVGSMRLPESLAPPEEWPAAVPGLRLLLGLRRWAESSPVPIVLFLDEIDALRGEGLRSVLRQLRAGFTDRPEPFPASVILCGLRDVRDYKAASGGDPERIGTASPFNIKVASLRLGDFTVEEVEQLYAQHTAETGQEFTPSAVAAAFEFTRGQPWLVNALAHEVVDEMGIETTEPITVGDIELAKERLVQARATHLDSLSARLNELRVRRVIGPLIAGEVGEIDPNYSDDVAYARDLGLITPMPPIEVANPIYREVIVRVLGTQAEDTVSVDPRAFVLTDGRLDFRLLLEKFACFWKENGEVLTSGEVYHEAATQIVFTAFLQRVVNGGGFVDREYGVGRGRMDVLVRWPYTDADGERQCQREAIELKVWAADRPDPTATGLAQLDRYLDRLDLESGALIVFDRRPSAPPIGQRTEFSEEPTPAGRHVTLLRA